MSDPAIEAARRAVNGGLGFPNGPVDAFAVSAAREALKPIKARHRPVKKYAHPDSGLDCIACSKPWPCPDALDTYNTEELNRMDKTAWS